MLLLTRTRLSSSVTVSLERSSAVSSVRLKRVGASEKSRNLVGLADNRIVLPNIVSRERGVQCFQRGADGSAGGARLTSLHNQILEIGEVFRGDFPGHLLRRRAVGHSGGA